MPLSYDPDYAPMIEPILEMIRESRPPVNDIATRRQQMEMFMKMRPKFVLPENIAIQKYELLRADRTVNLMWITKTPIESLAPTSALLYIHEGGMITGSPERSSLQTMAFVLETGVPILTVEYGLAPENPHPGPVEDCYAALSWLIDNASKLNVVPHRIGVFGESAGGGLAAAVMLMARDKHLQPPLKHAILIYPMLDDRNIVATGKYQQMIEPWINFNWVDNETGWRALLGDAAGGSDVSPYAAPARATDLSNLPPTLIDVGQLDIFALECTEFATRMIECGGSVEFHLRPGCVHAYDKFLPTSRVAQRQHADIVRIILSL